MSVKDIEIIDSDDSSSSDSPDSEGALTSAVSALDAKTRVSRPKTLDLRREVLVYRSAAPTLPREHLKLRSTRSLEPATTTSNSESVKNSRTAKHKGGPQSVRCANGSSSQPVLNQTSNLEIQSPKTKQKLRAVRSLDTSLLVKQSSSDSESSVKSPDSYSPSPTTKRRFPYLQKLAATMRVGGHHHSNSNSGSTGSTPSPSNDSPNGGGGDVAVVFDDSPFHSHPTGHSRHPSSDSPISPSSPSVMHRMKLPGSPSQKLNPKKLWRGKGHHHHQNKLQATPVLATSFWTPVGNGWWQSVTGRRVQLSSVDIANISEIERRHLQKAAYHRLQAYNVGPIILPRDPLQKRPKKGGLLKTGRQRTSSFLDSLRDMTRDNKEATSFPLVFGIPLEKCIRNDRELRQYEAERCRERRESLDLAQPLLSPASINHHLSEHSISSSNKLARSVSSPSSSRAGRAGGAANSAITNATLLDALSLSTAAVEECRQMRRKSLAPLEPQVPRLVSSCFRHVEMHGMRVLGIFRVGGSKKRIRQLREEYDAGELVQLNSSVSPHDVGALLKEYFRDLPEPLLTRELYTAFVGTAKLSNSLEQQKEALRLLVYLLPIAHRDTLRALLEFLRDVAMHSADVTHEDGSEQQGNKMDSINLATVFGPNILRRTKSGELKGEAADHMEENRDVIQVVQRLIDHNEEMFMISGEMHDEVLRRLHDLDSEALDYLLNKRLNHISSEDNEEAQTSEPMETKNGDEKFHVSQSDNILEIHDHGGMGSDIFESSDDTCLDRRKGNPRAHEWLLRGSVKVSAEMARQKGCSLPHGTDHSRSRGGAGISRTAMNARLSSMLADCDEVTIPDILTLSEEAELAEQSETADDDRQRSASVSSDQPSGEVEAGAHPQTSPSTHRQPPRLVIPQHKGACSNRSPLPKTFRVTSTSPRQRSVSQPPDYNSVKAGSSGGGGTRKENDIWIPVFEMQASGLYSPQMPRRSYLERSQWIDNSEVNNNSTNREHAHDQKARQSSSSSGDVGQAVTPSNTDWSAAGDATKIRSNSEVSSPPSSAWFTPPSTPDTPRSMDAVEIKGDARTEAIQSDLGHAGRKALSLTRSSWDASADDEEWVKRWEFLTSEEDGEFWGQETLV
ncbi:uncharacterized protein [Diadema antillarum]|uniref:uncharacterized protein n=1 Tax=Diadema antillarum TaxID=105358 RepID=UPI003A877147